MQSQRRLDEMAHWALKVEMPVDFRARMYPTLMIGLRWHAEEAEPMVVIHSSLELTFP